jgi:DNA excision repair protein ERCC-2
MPSGTGKTVSLLSLIVSYQQVRLIVLGLQNQSQLTVQTMQFFPTKRKLVYCSRTVPEIEKALAELKRLMAYRIECAETEEEKEKERSFMGFGLTSRKNLCINPDVRKKPCHLNVKLIRHARSQRRKKGLWSMPGAAI